MTKSASEFAAFPSPAPQSAGLRALAAQLHPGGVFAMWSDDPSAETFLTALREVFTKVPAETVSFPNPLLERESSSTVYLAERGD